MRSHTVHCTLSASLTSVWVACIHWMKSGAASTEWNERCVSSVGTNAIQVSDNDGPYTMRLFTSRMRSDSLAHKIVLSFSVFGTSTFEQKTLFDKAILSSPFLRHNFFVLLRIFTSHLILGLYVWSWLAPIRNHRVYSVWGKVKSNGARQKINK